MKKIALTGFGLFSTHSVNPTQLLAEKLGKEEMFSSVVIPVSYSRCWSYAEGVEGEVLLMMGLAAGRKDISVERCAYNEMRASIPDVDGVVHDGDRIADDMPEKLTTSIDCSRLVDILMENGIQAHVSEDPGRYICNDIYFNALSKGRRPALFIHVPSLDDMDEATMEKAIRLIAGNL